MSERGRGWIRGKGRGWGSWGTGSTGCKGRVSDEAPQDWCRGRGRVWCRGRGRGRGAGVQRVREVRGER